MRITMAAARIVMGEWGREITNICLREEMKIWLSAIYVDDVRMIISALEKGKRWQEKEKRFTYKVDWEKEDNEKEKKGEEDDTKRTAREMRKAMDSVFQNIKFETELEQDFEEKKLPTLDLEIWFEEREERKEVEGRRKIIYRFYEKPMNTPYSIMKASAMPEGGKIASLSQDVVRRMQNTSEMLGQQERNEIVNKYISKLTTSGYKEKQVKEIIENGLKGYERKLSKARKDGREIHREAAETISTRQRKKLMARTTWYKKKKGEKLEMQNGKRGNPKNKQAGDIPQVPPPIMSVLFVPKTEGGELATRLRQEEEMVSRVTADKIKIQERSGRMLKSILHQSNPWAGEPCGRPDCLICSGGEENPGDCQRRNIVYRTSCIECRRNGKKRYYFGESGRSGFERGKEHRTDFLSMNTDSHMLKHAVVEHGGDTDLQFSMKVLKGHMTAFSRQIHEAVVIEKNESSSILNSRGEYNRCSLPRLTVKDGMREMKEKEWCDAMTDQEIENEILLMRNRKRKDLAEKTDRPPPKRRRRWFKELKKEIQQKRRREEKSSTEIEENKVVKRRKVASAREESRSKENLVKKLVTQERRKNGVLLKTGKICPVAQASCPDQGEYDGVGIEVKEGPCHKLDQQNFLKNNSILKGTKLPEEYFPIFNFSAVRQVGGEGNTENKAKPELSPTTTNPTNSNCKVNPKPKPRTAHSSKKSKSKSKSQPNFKFKPMSEFFTKMKKEAQIITGLEPIICPEDHPPTT